MRKEFTTTTYILSDQGTLLIFHPKLHKWLPPGGHMEADETPPEAARREVKEETGLEISWIHQENLWIERWNATSLERPYMCLLENIPPYKNQPAHQHIDFIFVAKPSGGCLLKGPDIRWFNETEIEKLESDVEIFLETKETLFHLFKSIPLHSNP